MTNFKVSSLFGVVIALLPLTSMAKYEVPEWAEKIAEGRVSTAYLIDSPNLKSQYKVCSIVGSSIGDNGESRLVFEKGGFTGSRSLLYTEGLTTDGGSFRTLAVELSIQGNQEKQRLDVQGVGVNFKYVAGDASSNDEFNNQYDLGVSYTPRVDDMFELMVIDGMKVKKINFFFDKETILAHGKCIKMLPQKNDMQKDIQKVIK